MSSSTDPCSWSVDELVNELCHDTTLLQATGYAPEHYPNRAVLERQLRSQGVNGQRFLTNLDVRTLRSELGLENLGQRMALVSLIEILRQRSRQYAQSAPMIGVALLNLNRTQQQEHHSSIGSSFRNHVDNSSSHRRHNVAHINIESSRTMAGTSGSNVGNEDWSHLLRWQPANGDDEDVDMADLGELEDEPLQEGGDSTDDELSDAPDDEEDDVEQMQQARARCKLNHDEIVDIINDSIARYTDVWEPNTGLPKEDWVFYEPERMWEDAEAGAERENLVKNYEAEVEYYTRSLDMLCDEIIKVPGNNAVAVRRQCKNLEVTVNNLELARWLLSIYALSPESESDEDVHDAEVHDAEVHDAEVHDAEHGDQLHNWNQESQSTPKTQPDQYATHIIDLGLPPASSIGDTEVGPTLNLTPRLTRLSVAPDAAADEVETSNRLNTPEADIVITIEENGPFFPNVNLKDQTINLKLPVNHGDEPEKASITTVRRWNWKDLTATQDRKRIVSKAIYELRAAEREEICSRIALVGRTRLEQEVQAFVDMLSRGESRIHGVLQRDLVKIEMISKLFVSWWYCDNYFAKTPSIQHLEELRRYFRDGPSDFEFFFDFVNTIMKTTFSDEALQHPERPSQAEIIEISDDEDLPTISSSTRRTTAPYRIPGSQQASAIVLD